MVEEGLGISVVEAASQATTMAEVVVAAAAVISILHLGVVLGSTAFSPQMLVLPWRMGGLDLQL